jgi:hypothetical protein
VAWAKQRLPLGPSLYPRDVLSEHPERFFIAEIVREQLFLQYRQEVCGLHGSAGLATLQERDATDSGLQQTRPGGERRRGLHQPSQAAALSLFLSLQNAPRAASSLRPTSRGVWSSCLTPKRSLVSLVRCGN